MCKNLRFKVVLSVLLGILLVFGATLDGYAGSPEPPTGGKASKKKNLVGLLSATVTHDICGDPIFRGVIVADCNGPVSFSKILNTNYEQFAATTAEDLLPDPETGVPAWYLPEAGPPGCFSPGGGEDLVITDVDNFVNASTAIAAEVTLSVYEYPAP